MEMWRDFNQRPICPYSRSLSRWESFVSEILCLLFKKLRTIYNFKPLFLRRTLPTKVLLGDKHLEKLDSFSSQRRVETSVEEIFVHPDYKRPIKYNDIGLIKLDRKVKFSRMIYPACLPQPDDRPETISEFLTAGWGRLEYFGRHLGLGMVLLSVSMFVIIFID